MRWLAIGLLALVTAGCEPDPAEPADDTATTADVAPDTASAVDTATSNQAPTAPEVAINPTSPNTTDDLAVALVALAVDEDGPEALSYRYVWALDGVEQSDTERTLSAARTAKGQRWSVRVWASDGDLEGPEASAETTIVDAPPTLSGAALDLTEVSVLETLTCTPVGFADPDGDPESVRARWLQLGEGDARSVVAEEGLTFSPAALSPGDRILCELTPLSGELAGEPIESPTATVVAPTAPVVALSAPDGVDGEARCEVTIAAAHVGDAATTTFYWTVNGGAEEAGQATRGGLVDCDVLSCRAEVTAGELTLSAEAATLALPLGPACDTDAVCRGPVCAEGGGCATEPLSGTSCDALDPCLGPGTCDAGACAPASTPAEDGTSCDDADPCTVDTTCTGGTCGGGSPADDGTSCDDGDACTIDDVCAAAVCVGGGAADDGAACDDGDGCTTGDLCAAGACAPGAPVDCAEAGGACAVGVCQSTGPDSHQCAAEPRSAGASCSAPDVCAAAAYCDDAGQCVEGAPPAITDARTLTIDIGAHALDTVQDAVWDVTVQKVDESGDPIEQVLATRVASSQCGENGSAASVQAACDAAGTDEVVTARLRGLYTTPVSLPGRFGDPVPEGGIAFADPGDLVRTVECLDLPENQLSYDVAIARPAADGLITKSVNFDQIYCAANFTCCSDDDDDGICDADVDLLFDASGQRSTTFKLGFACAAETSANMDLALYMDDLVLTCDGTDIATIHPLAGDGNLCTPGQVGSCSPKIDVAGAGAGYLFQAAIYKGDSSFAGVDRVWWNIALGVDKAAIAAGDCQLTTRATADTDAVAGGAQGGTITAPDVYPYIVWDVNVSDGAGVVCVEHTPDTTPAYVYATYSDGVNDETFGWGYNP